MTRQIMRWGRCGFRIVRNRFYDIPRREFEFSFHNMYSDRFGFGAHATKFITPYSMSFALFFEFLFFIVKIEYSFTRKIRTQFSGGVIQDEWD